MVNFPENPRVERTRTFVKDAVLATLALGGMMTLAILAPNALQLLRPLLKNKRLQNSKVAVYTAVKRLNQQGLIYFEKTEKGTFVRLTEKGKAYLHTRLAKPDRLKRWDGKWRILIFDIKEYRRKTRDKLRRTLIYFGFKHLQHSVWIYPYDCEDLIVLLKADFKIGKDVLYIVAEKVENDLWLKKHFSL